MTVLWRGENEKQMQVPVRLRSGQAFDSAERRFAQDDSSVERRERKANAGPRSTTLRAGFRLR